MRFIKVTAILLALTCSCNAQDSLNVAKIGSLYDFWSFTICGSYNEGYVYIPDVASGIRVLDVSDPFNPTQVTTWSIQSSMRMILNGDTGYCISFIDGLISIDVSDPLNGTQLDNYELYVSGSETRLSVEGSLLTVSEPEFGVHFLNVSNPANITFLSTYTEIPVGNTILYGDYAYVSEYESSRLDVLDISNPFSPVYLGSIAGPGDIDDWAIHGTMLYIAGDEDGMVIYSLSNPSTPALISSYPTVGSCKSIAVLNNYAYLGIEDQGLEIVNVSNPWSPVWVATHMMGQGEIESIVLEGDYAYTVGGYPVFNIFDVSDPHNPDLLGSTGTGAWIHGIHVENDLVFAADQSGWLYISDVTDPANPEEVSEIGPLGHPAAIAASDSYAYVASDDDEIFKVDVSDPAGPWVADVVALDNDPYGLYERGDTLFVAGTWTVFDVDFGKLTVLDYTVIPPQIVSETILSGGVFIHVDGSTAYITSSVSNTFSIVDITNPANPVVISETLNAGDCQGCVNHGDYLYVANGGVGDFQVYEISDPSSPTLVNSIDCGAFVSSIRIANNRLVVGAFGDNMTVYELTDPANPSLYGYYPSNSLEIYTVGDFVYAAELRAMSIYQIGPVEPDPVTLTLTGVNTTVPVGGGDVTYTASLVSTIGATYPNLLYWTRATTPNGTQTGVLFQQGFHLIPFMDVTVGPLAQQVPGFAPPGGYTYTGYVGYYPVAYLQDSFSFTKLGAAIDDEFEFDLVNWPHSDKFITGDPTEGENVVSDLPSEYTFEGAYPNPFNPTTTVSVSLPDAANLNVVVYNVAGQQVAELANGSYNAGTHTLTFDASGLASGLYFIRATVPGHLDQVQKVMLVR